MSKLLLVIFVAAAVSVVSANEVELTDDNFQSKLDNTDVALVMFYAPWCGHCKKLKPEFTKAAKTLAANDPPVLLAKVDCTEGGQEKCGQFGVSGYPTLKVFRNGEVDQDYNGGRTADSIVKTMRGLAGPASKEMASQVDLDAFLGIRKDPAVVFYGPSKAGLEVFLKVAAKLREKASFAHFPGHPTEEGVKLVRPKRMRNVFEESEVSFGNDLTSASLEKFVKENVHGLVGHRTEDNAGDFAADTTVIAFYNVDYDLDLKGTNYWRNRVLKVAKAHREVRFAVSNRFDMQREVSEFGGSADGGEGVFVAARSGGKKYAMADPFSVDNLEKFVGDLESGRLEAYLKSEPVPEPNDGPVKVAVAKNFDEVVVRSDNDVLVEFYAPWCGHCKKLAPVFDELGEKMAGKAVDIVKMDATANDVPAGYDVSGFPTLFWVPADTKKPEAYSGGRELDDFVKFIKAKATHKATKTEL